MPLYIGRIRDYDQFKRVRVALDTIEWDGGLDLDPEFVYAKCKTIGVEGQLSTLDGASTIGR